MKLIYTAMATALLAASPAAMATDEGGFYAGAGIGLFGVDEGNFDESDTGFKLFGGWMFNQYVGGEVEYIGRQPTAGVVTHHQRAAGAPPVRGNGIQSRTLTGTRA